MNIRQAKARLTLANNLFCVLLQMYRDSHPGCAELDDSDNINRFTNFIAYIDGQNLITIAEKMKDFCRGRFEQVLREPEQWRNLR